MEAGVVTSVRAGLLALVLTAGLVAPAAADELDEARGELGGARTELAQVEQTVQRTRDEVAATDERLRDASTDLSRVRTTLAEAEAAMADAVAEERATAAALEEANAGLDRAVDTFSGSRDQLAQRAVSAYKHGGRAAHQEMLVRGVAGAGDWHDVAVTMETVGRLLRADRDLVDTSAEATREIAGARGDVTSARRSAMEAQRVATRHRQEVARLVSTQERVVAAVDRELDRRQEALERLESDASARAVLVRDLEERVQRLELARIPPPAPAVSVVQVDLDDQGPAPAWAGRLPANGQAWAAAIDAAASAHGIDGRLLAAVVWTESNFRPEVVSHAGAIGLAQLMPGTARGLGVDPRDPLANLSGGAAYLRAQLSRFGRADLALAAYNAGPTRVAAAGPGIPNIVETQLYVVRVLERYERLSGS
jgi:soluble lytic murein transglycosylase-like protein